jgi:hypothetical protein
MSETRPHRKGPGRAAPGGTLVRGNALISALLVVLLAGGLGRVISHASPFILSNPANVFALLLVLAGGPLLARMLLPLRIRAAWSWCGFGILAAWLGAGLEAGARDLWMDLRSGTAGPGLGLLAGGARVFALWLVLAFLRKRGVLRNPTWRPRVALSVGLAFGLTSELLLWEQQLVRRVELLPHFGLYALEGVATVAVGAFSGLVLGGNERVHWRDLAFVLLAQSLLLGGPGPSGVLALRLPGGWGAAQGILGLLLLAVVRPAVGGSTSPGRSSIGAGP